MRILMIGRPPRPHWRLPVDAEIVVCGSGVPEHGAAPGRGYTGVPVLDPSDLEQLLCALTHHAGVAPGQGEWWDFDAVYCDYEHALVNAAVIATIAGAEIAMSPAQATLGRDKWRQKEAAREAGIRTAAAELARAGAPPGLPAPLVVKPLLGSAGRDVRRYDDPGEAMARAAELTAREPVLYETFVHGPECHIDGIVAGGRLVLLTVGFYLTNIMDTDRLRPTGSCVVPHADDPELYARAEDLMTRAARAFGMNDGVMHLEAFDGPDGLVFSECGFRRAGGKSSETVALATRADYRELACLASLGLLEPGPLRLPERAAAWVMIKSPPGLLTGLPGEHDFAGIPGLEEVVVHHHLLDTWIDGMPGAYERAGHVIVTGPTAAGARAAVKEAADVFHRRVSVEPATVAAMGSPR